MGPSIGVPLFKETTMYPDRSDHGLGSLAQPTSGDRKCEAQTAVSDPEVSDEVQSIVRMLLRISGIKE